MNSAREDDPRPNPDPEFEREVAPFEPLEARVQLPIPGEIVARGKMLLRPPAAEPAVTEEAEAPSAGDAADARTETGSDEAGDAVEAVADPPPADEPDRPEPVFTEVRLDAVRSPPSWDRSAGTEAASTGAPWPIIGYVLRYREKSRRGGFRKLLDQTFATVPHAMDALANHLDIPDESLVPPRAYRIRQGLSGTIGKHRRF